VYVAKLNPSGDEYVTEDEAVHEAIWDAIEAGHITEAFGRFWVGDGYIIIDKPTEMPTR
jgi:hypothetical protein